MRNEWHIGLSTGCFYGCDILDVLEPIRDNGFQLLEICSFRKHLDYNNVDHVREAARRIHDLGLEALSMHAPFADSIDVSQNDRKGREEAVGEIQRAADAAAVLGVRYLVIHPGPEREGEPPNEERWQRLEDAAEALTRIANHCRDLGINLLLENMLPHLLLGSAGNLLHILGSIAATDVGICLDTGHAHLGRELEMIVSKFGGHLEMIHAHDNRGDFDSHLPPGEGGIDWDRLLRELEKIDYRGAIILELCGDGHSNPRDILAGARKARGFLERRMEAHLEEVD